MLECEIELLLANSGHLASDSSVLYFAFDDGPYHEIQLTVEGTNSIPSADDVITKPKAAAKIIAELTEDGAKIKELIKKVDSGANGELTSSSDYFLSWIPHSRGRWKENWHSFII